VPVPKVSGEYCGRPDVPHQYFDLRNGPVARGILTYAEAEVAVDCWGESMVWCWAY
jgi:hypothetical protein